MLYRKGHSLWCNIEHNENHRLVTIVFSVVDSAYHFNNGLSLVHHLDIAIDVDNGEFALLNKPKVYHVVVVPCEFLSRRKLISY